jgi:cytochrome oxidase Cu insertion factor (SCO1/SenC/PrrC family)
MSGQAAAGGGKRGIFPLLAMIVVFAAPVIAAWFFYLNPDYRPAGRTNKGELISPVVSLPADLGLRTLEGADFDPAVLEGKWTLVYLDAGECGDHCKSRLVDLRQIRLAVGESQMNVDRLWILADPPGPDRMPDLGGGFDGMKVAMADAAAEGRLLGLLGEGADALGRVYILDPMGNLMMRYAQDAPAEDTLKDMERLLKASKNWIKGAQYGHK